MPPLPECWFDAEFVHALHQAAKAMSKNFAQRFVDLRRTRFASEAVAKLGFDHVEGCFDV